MTASPVSDSPQAYPGCPVPPGWDLLFDMLEVSLVTISADVADGPHTVVSMLRHGERRMKSFLGGRGASSQDLCIEHLLLSIDVHWTLVPPASTRQACAVVVNGSRMSADLICIPGDDLRVVAFQTPTTFVSYLLNRGPVDRDLN